MFRPLLPLLILPLVAASPPPRGLSLTVPDGSSPLLPVSPPNPSRPSPLPQRFEAAPLPNRDVDAPTGPRATDQPSVAPGLFTRRDEYRGDGFSNGSTAQTDQDKRVRPGAGFKLRVPLTGQ